MAKRWRGFCCAVLLLAAGGARLAGARPQSGEALDDMPKVTLECRLSLAAQDAEVAAIAWNADGGMIAALAPVLRYAKVFSIPDGRELGSIGDLPGGAESIAFAADGRVLLPPLNSATSALALWAPGAAGVSQVPGPNPGQRDALGNMLFAHALDGARTRLAGLHRVRQGASVGFALAVYDTRSWSLLADYPLSGTLLALRPDGRRAALAVAGGYVSIADLASGREILRFKANRNEVEVLAWSPDGTRLATGAMSQGFGLDTETGKYGPLQDQRVLQLWDAASGKPLAAAQEDIGGGVESFDFSPDGRWLATTTSDGTLRIWDAGSLSRQVVLSDQLHPNTAVVRFSPDGRRLAVALTGRGQILVYRTR